mmetsp:Transcript_5042/g.11855  ORF Transcript_5042/g.11855 Transcript_5042/m.11855 type:complete len:618 (-) Transcript_5042:282-2135(-)
MSHEPASSAAKPPGRSKEAWFEGIATDLKLRLPLYGSDWTVESSAQAQKILAATLFAYFTSVLPAVIFGDQLALATDGTMGLMEVLMSTGGLGILYSIFAGQGLVIVGVTGPVVFFEVTVWAMAKQMKAPFMQMNAWVNIWCGIMHIVVAAGGYTKLVQQVTAFSGEIFGFFISVAYIFLGFRNIIDLFPTDLNSATQKSTDDPAAGQPTSVHLASAFASVVLAASMYSSSMSLHHAKEWRILNDSLRWVGQNYGVVLMLVACTALSFVPVFENDQIALQRLPVPFGSWAENQGPVPSTTKGRVGDSFVVSLMGSDGDGNKMEAWMVFVAIFPALMLLILFFFDHNVSSILAQDPKFNLKKPPAFNWDFAVLGFGVMLCGVFGVPPGNGLIPQAPLHVRALAVVEYEDTPGGRREVYAAVVEKRWSNLIQSVLCLITIFLFPLLKLIPQAVLAGTFLYMGASGFFGNALWDRFNCMLMEAKRRPDYDFVTKVGWPQVRKYTLLQLFSVALIFFVAFNFFMPEGSPSVAVVFPVIIAILIPLREFWIPTEWEPEELLVLDPPADASADPPADEETNSGPEAPEEPKVEPKRAKAVPEAEPTKTPIAPAGEVVSVEVVS